MRDKHNRLYVLTGPPGSGKTSILDCFKDLKLTCVSEPARRVIAQQRATGGQGTSEQNPQLFIDLMLECSRADYRDAVETDDLCLFDRGIPDLLAYAKYYGLDPAAIEGACDEHRYAKTVFYAPAWADIFMNDAERKLTFKQAATFGRLIKSAYARMGYDLHVVPFGNPGSRAAHILKVMRSH